MPSLLLSDYLQHALQQASTAKHFFDQYWSSRSQSKASSEISQLTQSLETFETCLQHIETHAPPEIDLRRFQKFMKKVNQWRQEFSLQQVISQEKSPTVDYFYQLNQYYKFLNQLKRLLNRFIVIHAGQFASANVKKQLHQIYPISLPLRFFFSLIQFLFVISYRKLFLRLGIVCGLLIVGLLGAGFWYFFTPYQTAGFLLPIQKYSHSTEDNIRFSENTQHPFEIASDGEWQTLLISLPEGNVFDQFLLSFDLRRERVLEVKTVELLNAQKQVLMKYDLMSLDQRDWWLANDVSIGSYQVREQTFDGLKRLNDDSAFANQFKNSVRHLSLDFTPEVLRRLETLQGITFENKTKFNHALDQLNLSLDWSHQKLIRTASKLPLYKHKAEAPPLTMVSPELDPIINRYDIKLIRVQLRIHYPPF